jgi:SAM-dependent methyltransferase
MREYSEVVMDKLVEQQREHFNSISDRYFEARQRKTHILLKDLIWKDALSKLGRFWDGEITILEPMCGYAEGLDIICKHIQGKISYTGFDYSDEIVSYLNQNRPELRVFHGDVTKIAFDTGQYDIIILIGGLHHVPRHASEVVRRLAKSLRKQGLFISFEPTHGNLLAKYVRERIYTKNQIFDHQTERDFSVNDLESMFMSAGLKKDRIMYPGLLAYILYYNPYAFPSLSKGGPAVVKSLYALDRLLMTNWLGRMLSFATLSIWRRS